MKQVERQVARSSTERKAWSLLCIKLLWRVFFSRLCVPRRRYAAGERNKWWDFALKVKSHSLPPYFVFHPSSFLCLSPPTFAGPPFVAGLAQPASSSPLYKRTPDFSPFTNRHFEPVCVDVLFSTSLSKSLFYFARLPPNSFVFSPFAASTHFLSFNIAGGLVRLKFSKIRLDPTQKLSTMARVLIAIAILIGAGTSLSKFFLHFHIFNNSKLASQENERISHLSYN